ncbi:hypothetical protein PCLA_16r0009 [Pseudomonas citronellolis]|nr:hypothetical protein PCLA_16r0009 [Pseudomonas citronellolis]
MAAGDSARGTATGREPQTQHCRRDTSGQDSAILAGWNASR